MIGREDLERRFAFHPADTPVKRDAHELVRTRHLQLANELDATIPDGREKSLAITALEQSMMWSNAAIARADTYGKG